MSPGASTASSSQSRVQTPSDERSAVLHAALVVAQQRGYHGTTLDRVAEAAGTSPDRVTAHFRDRHEMLTAALEMAFEHWYDEVPTWKPSHPLPDLEEEIARRLTRGVVAGRRAADFWRLGLLLRLEPALAGSDCWELFVEIRERTRSALLDYWRSILPAGTAADPALVELVVRGHLSLVDGSVLAAHATPDWDLERMMGLVATGVTAALERRTGAQVSASGRP
jgi:AcrR family transcriptional regulator